jgi:hypothetical protein
MSVLPAGLATRTNTRPTSRAPGLWATVTPSVLEFNGSHSATDYSTDALGHRLGGRTPAQWLADSARAGAAWAGSIVRHASERRHRSQSERDRREGLYMERARMAREMHRL